MNPTSSGSKTGDTSASSQKTDKSKNKPLTASISRSVRMKEYRPKATTNKYELKKGNQSRSADNLRDLTEGYKRKAISPLKTSTSSKRKMTSQLDASLESITGMQTDDTGIISEYGSESPTNNNINDASKNPIQTSTTIAKKVPAPANYARIDLNSPESLANLPQNTRQVLISSTEDNIKLAKLNPFRIQQEIDAICNEVENVEHCKSGSLLITTKTLEQVHTLLKLKHFTASKISVTTAIAWSKQLSYGKIFAPEFQQDSLQYLLTIMQDQGVVSIRKLFADPEKANVPLYVLTFLEATCPTKIKIGYCSYNIDKYYPSPQRCNKCCRWGHSATNCRSNSNCSKCGKNGHTHKECTATTEMCINCKQPHGAFAKECPVYQKELQACHLSVDLAISLSEARAITRNNQTNNTQRRNAGQAQNPTTQPTLVELSSESAFPSLTQLMNRSSNQDQSDQDREPEKTVTYHGTANKETQSDTEAEEDEIQSSQPRNSKPNAWTTPRHWLQRKETNPTNQNRMTPYSIQNTIELMTPSLPKAKYHTTENNRSNQIPSVNAVPSTSQCNSSSPTTHTKAKEKTTLSNSLDIKQLILHLLPIFIKLILAKDFTDKLECILELGKFLEADAQINKMLQQLGISSILQSQ